mgnify:CR=1 FL=1
MKIQEIFYIMKGKKFKKGPGACAGTDAGR